MAGQTRHLLEEDDEIMETMKKSLAVLLAAIFLSSPVAGVRPFAAAPAEAQQYDRLSREELDNLLAPVALYPDPLLAQILVAATFDEDVEDASAFVRRRNDPNAIDNQPWDVSVKAVAHYPSVINMMAERIDWTVALGQAYVEQPQDVMDAVQRLRWQARRAGNLNSGQYHEVVVERDYINIFPYRPEVIFVPVYDPAWIFFRPAAVITWGVAFPIGVWLNHDFDWGGHRVFYHGWSGNRGWILRSRSHIRITNVYVNNNFRTVVVNRNIVRRNVNVANLNRFNSIHREARFEHIERRNEIRGRAGDVKGTQREASNVRDRDRGERNRETKSPGGPGKGSIQSEGTKSGDRKSQRSQQLPDKNRGPAREERLRDAKEDRGRRGGQGQGGEGQPGDQGVRRGGQGQDGGGEQGGQAGRARQRREGKQPQEGNQHQEGKQKREKKHGD
jgi:hypothetical protein